MQLKEICIATSNRHKIEEIRAIFAQYTNLTIKLCDLMSFSNIPEPAEPFNNYLNNAIHKAKFYSQYTQMPTLSEDTGLEVVNLNNFPGVLTKRFIEEQGGFVGANQKIYEMLNGQDATARFVCEAVIFEPKSNKILHSRGEMNGKIIFENIAKNGFAYDTMFVPNGYHQPIAELGSDVKIAISHRSVALKKLIKQISGK